MQTVQIELEVFNPDTGETLAMLPYNAPIDNLDDYEAERPTVEAWCAANGYRMTDVDWLQA